MYLNPNPSDFILISQHEHCEVKQNKENQFMQLYCVTIKPSHAQLQR